MFVFVKFNSKTSPDGCDVRGKWKFPPRDGILLDSWNVVKIIKEHFLITLIEWIPIFHIYTFTDLKNRSWKCQTCIGTIEEYLK